MALYVTELSYDFQDILAGSQLAVKMDYTDGTKEFDYVYDVEEISTNRLQGTDEAGYKVVVDNTGEILKFPYDINIPLPTGKTISGLTACRVVSGVRLEKNIDSLETKITTSSSKIGASTRAGVIEGSVSEEETGNTLQTITTTKKNTGIVNITPREQYALYALNSMIQNYDNPLILSNAKVGSIVDKAFTFANIFFEKAKEIRNVTTEGTSISVMDTSASTSANTSSNEERDDIANALVNENDSGLNPNASVVNSLNALVNAIDRLIESQNLNTTNLTMHMDAIRDEMAGSFSKMNTQLVGMADSLYTMASKTT